MAAFMKETMGTYRAKFTIIAAVTAVVSIPYSCFAQETKQENERVVATVHDFGKMTQLWNEGKNAEIESLYRQALQIEEKNLGKDNADIAKLLSDLAVHYDNRGLSDKAEPLYRRALTILDKTPNANLEDLKTCLSGLGYACERKQQLSQAEQFFKRALTVHEKIASDPNEELLAMSLDSLAQVYTKEGKYAQAKVLLKRSLAMREQTYGADGRMVKICLEKLSDINQKMGNQKETEQLSTRVLAIKKKDYGPVLGPFFMQVQEALKNNSHICILPLSSKLGVGAPFDEKVFTAEIKKKLGGDSAEWCKIPDWLAGLWQSREIPPHQQTIEVEGALWDDPPPSGFYEGPGPYAMRKGAIPTKDGWWEHHSADSSDFWTRGGSQGDKFLEYSFCHRHHPVTTGNGNVIFRQSTIFFRVRPMIHAKTEVLLPPGTVTAVWQEDSEEVYGKISNDQVALYSGTSIYGWNGKKLSSAPGDPARTANESVTMKKRLGKAAPLAYKGFNAKKSLRAFLTKQKKFDELKLLDSADL